MGAHVPNLQRCREVGHAFHYLMHLRPRVVCPTSSAGRAYHKTIPSPVPVGEGLPVPIEEGFYQSQLKRGLPVPVPGFVRISDGPDYPARVAGRHTIVGNKYYFLDTLPIIGQSTPSAYAT